MKRIVICVFFLSILSFSMLLSQFKVGFYGGMNLSNVVFEPKTESMNLSSRTGFIFGGISEISLTKNLYLMPGINYIQKGFKYEYTNTTNEKYTVTAKHDYISIPVSIKYDFMPKSEVRPFLTLTPDIGFKLSYATEINGEEEDLDPDGTNFETTNFSLNFGGGLDFEIDPKQDWFILVQYSLGLTDLSKNHGGETIHQTNKLNGIQISIGIKFTIQ
jgi:hypothetical protein